MKANIIVTTLGLIGVGFILHDVTGNFTWMRLISLILVWFTIGFLLLKIMSKGD